MIGRKTVLLSLCGLALAVALSFVGCSHSRIVRHSEGPVRIELFPKGHSVTQISLPYLIVGDNQRHNLEGGYIRTMGAAVRELVTPVASRPPEVNLWSQLTLESFVADAAGDDQVKLILHLGDAADIGCVNEFDRFAEGMRRSTSGKPWVMVPGNHDSFMAGNMNDFQPKSPEEGFFDAFGRPPLQTAQRSWSGACASLDAKSNALTKDILVDKLAAVLESQGVRFGSPEGLGEWESLRATQSREGEVACRIRYASAPPRSGALAGYEAVLRTCPPKRLPGGTVIGAWESFIVQKVPLSEGIVAILLDTSDVTASGLPAALAGRNAAQMGTIRWSQLRAIDFLLRRSRGSRVIGLGHSPWGEMHPAARAELLARGLVAYVSGHTHFRSSLLAHRATATGILEINVGSTTDAPLQALRFGVMPREKGLRLGWHTLGSHDQDERPTWLRSCAEVQAQWRESKNRYRAYLEYDRLRGVTDDGELVRALEPLKEAIARAERVIFGKQREPSPASGEADRRAYPLPGSPTQRWLHLFDLMKRADRLELEMHSDKRARQFGVCQALWAAEAVEGDRAVRERITDKLRDAEEPTAYANETVGAVLTDSPH